MAEGVQTVMTVQSVSPVLVVADGATEASPASVNEGVAFEIGARVQVTTRDPLLPIVTGRQTEEEG